MKQGVRRNKAQKSICLFLLSSFFILLATCSFLPASPAFAYESPGRPQGYVSDFANVIAPAEEAAISAKLGAVDASYGFQVAVATIPSLGDETIETYAVKLFQDWGIGARGRDTGLLLLVAPNEREVKIETGYGTEGVVTDIQSGNIIREILLPAFREGNYGAGIEGGVDALSLIIAGSPEATRYSADSRDVSQSGGFDPFVLVFFGIIILNILAGILGKTKSWWLGGVIGAGIGVIIGLIWGFLYKGVAAVVILTILGLAFDYIVSKHPPKGGGRGGSGLWLPFIFMGGRGGRGGFGGGGFGGFGGGMSGGGGATGRW